MERWQEWVLAIFVLGLVGVPILCVLSIPFAVLMGLPWYSHALWLLGCIVAGLVLPFAFLVGWEDFPLGWETIVGLLLFLLSAGVAYGTWMLGEEVWNLWGRRLWWELKKQLPKKKKQREVGVLWSIEEADKEEEIKEKKEGMKKLLPIVLPAILIPSLLLLLNIFIISGYFAGQVITAIITGLAILVVCYILIDEWRKRSRFWIWYEKRHWIWPSISFFLLLFLFFSTVHNLFFILLDLPPDLLIVESYLFSEYIFLLTCGGIMSLCLLACRWYDRAPRKTQGSIWALIFWLWLGAFFLAMLIGSYAYHPLFSASPFVGWGGLGIWLMIRLTIPVLAVLDLWASRKKAKAWELEEQLKGLKEQMGRGAITREEYEQRKKKLLEKSES